MTGCALLPQRENQRGNLFAMLFASVALMGVLGAVGMQTLTGPVTTVTRVTQKNIADTQLLMSAKIIVNAAITGVADGDADADGLIEPSAFVPPSGGETAPTNGGFLPTDLGLTLTDPWGSKYGYCVWDHGTTNASANRLTGDNTASAPTQVVLAIIAAGPDKIFQTTCSEYAGGPVQVTKASGSDDLHFKYTYAEASANSNGLWSINVSDQAKAELKNAAGSQVNVSIDRDTGIGDFLGLTTGVISAKAAETIAVDGALLLDAAGATSDTCTAAEKGSIRLNADLDSIEICDGAGGFFDLTEGAKLWALSGNDIYATNTGNVGIGTPSPSQKLDVQGSANISANIAVGGAGIIGGDLAVNTDAIKVDAAAKRLGIGTASPSEALDVTGNAVIDGDGTITGSLTVDTDSLAVDANGDMVGVGTASPAHTLDVAGESDMGAIGSLATGDAVLHVHDGTANLYIDGRTIVSDAAVAFGTTGANALQLITSETARITVAASGAVSVAGDASIGGATALASTLTVAGIANFDAGTFYVDVPDRRVGIGTTDPLTKLDVTGGIKVGGDTLCNISKAGMVAWNSGVLQLCGADGNWASLAAIDKLDDIGDVDVPTPNNNDVLAWDGTNWVAKNIALLGSAGVNPAGNDGDIQFREGSDLGADSLLHWDSANKRLGVGTAIPLGPLTLVASGTNGGEADDLSLRSYSSASATGAPAVSLLRGRGTTGSPEAVLAGDFLGNLWFGGHNGTAIGNHTANLGAIAEHDFDTSKATALTFSTHNGTAVGERVRIAASGKVGIGTTTPQSLLQVSGGIQLGDDTATCPGASNVKLGTLRVNSGVLQLCQSGGWVPVGGGVPAGTIAAFAMSSCPAGWTEYIPARGRFLRAIDPSGSTAVDPDGTRAPGSHQEGSFVMNNAGSTSDLRVFTLRSTGLAGMNYDTATTSAPGFAGTWIQASGAVGAWGANTIDSNFVRVTRPRNVAVLFCQYGGGAPLVATPSGAAGEIQYADGSGGLDSDPNIIVSGGKVGIGTTSPSTALEVVGTIKGSGPLWSSFGSTETLRGLILENFDDTANATGVDIGAKLSGTEFQGLSWVKETAWTSASVAADKDVMLQLGVLNDNTPTNRVFIKANGNVGIGTASPRGRLDVAGAIITQNRLTLTADGTTTSPVWNIDNNADKFRLFREPTIWTPGTVYMAVLNNGNVGIGTTTPSAKLVVTSQSAADNKIEVNAGGDQYAALRVKNSQQSYIWQVTPTGDAPAGRLRLYKEAPSPGEFLTVLATGNVGIGTASPDAKLEVKDGTIKLVTENGSASLLLENKDTAGSFDNTVDEKRFQLMTTGMGGGDGSFGYKFSWRNADGSPRVDAMHFRKDGKVGIGTSSPDTTLDVAGQIRGKPDVYRIGGTISSSGQCYACTSGDTLISATQTSLDNCSDDPCDVDMAIDIPNNRVCAGSNDDTGWAAFGICMRASQ